MSSVACFCGCVYSFSGDVGVCPKCGVHTTYNHVAIEEERQMRRELDAILHSHDELVVADLTHRRSRSSARARGAELNHRSKHD